MSVKAISHSEYWLWVKSKKRWHERYVLGIEEPTSPAAELGKICHSALEKGASYDWQKALVDSGFEHKVEIVRLLLGKMAMKTLGDKEEAMSATFKTRSMPEPIQLFGFMDGIDKENKILAEYKTSERDEAWNQSIVNHHSQLSFYALMYNINYHSFFSDIQLHYLNTSRGTVETFHTARGPRDIEWMAREIEDMVRYCKRENLWEARISRENRAQKRMTPLFPEPAKEHD